MQRERILGAREVEEDDYSNYRRRYPGRRRSNHTWKYRVEKLARLTPKRLAMVQGDRRMNWDQFNRQCNRLAHGLERLGVRKEDRVAILGFNSIEWMESYFAASKIGAVPVNVNPRFLPEEIKYVLEDSDAVVVFVEEDYAGAIATVFDELPMLKHIIVYGVGQRPSKIPEKALIFEDVKTSDESDPDVKVYNDDFCFLMYTGGTTGYPKGTVWDGEQRVHGLDMTILNGLTPLIDKLSGFPEEALRGYFSLLISSQKAVKAFTWIFSRKSLRALLGSRLGKELFFLLSKATVGRPMAIKLMSFVQREGVKIIPACPLFHGAAYDAVFAHLGGQGAATVFLPTPHSFSAREFWEAVEQERVHTAVIVGDAFAIPMLEELKRARAEGRPYNPKSLWAMISSGVRWSPHVKRGLLDLVPGMLVMDEMGTSESSGAFTEMATSQDKEIKPAGAKLPKHAGGLYRHQLFPCRVINPETGKDVEPGSGEIGEFVYGGWMTLGYWKCPAKTAHDFRVIDGKRWFFVGDEGTVDADGKFNLVGRGGDYLINTGGEKVYSEEVEGIVKAHPKVLDVAVIGIPDPRWGQAVTALVELHPGQSSTEEEIVCFCRDRMAGYKRPRHVVFVDKVPRAAAGKVERELAMEIVVRELA